MSYYSDHDKYGDFFNSYSPTDRKRSPTPPRKPKRGKRHLRPWVKVAAFVLALVLVAVIFGASVSECGRDDTPTDQAAAPSDSTPSSVSAPESTENKYARPTENNATVTLGRQIESQYAILIDTAENTVLARRNADKRMYPASMTKVMTLLTFAENVDNIDGTFKMTSTVIDPLYTRGLALAGFAPNEEVRVIDMVYGMVLESGAEAAVGLAMYVAGTEEAFVELMNRKAAEMGLSETHFTNVTGSHDSNHYTTCTEMAIIFKAAIENDFCREVLSTERYNVAATEKRAELNFHSGMFSRMYGTEPEVATVKGGKTGFTNQAQFCLASYAITDDGREIICITAKGEQKYSPIYDCIELYKNYTH